MTRDELKIRLQQPYDREAWLALLRELFGAAVSVLASPYTISVTRADGLKLVQLGNLRLSDGRTLTLLEGEVGDRVQIRKNRVAIQGWAASHIDQHTIHGALAVFRGREADYRFTFVAKESEIGEDGQFVERQTAARRYTYLLGPGESCATAAQRFVQLAGRQERATLADVVDAFSVEKLNREFFQAYKEHYGRFVAHLLSGETPQRVFGIPRLPDEREQDKAHKPVRDFAKRLLGRLVFLHFIQKKGWMGCPADRSDWSGGDRDFVRNLFAACPDRERFHSARLVPLFYGTLNDPDRARSLFSITGTRVPYLNGGLFEREKMPRDHSPLPVERIDFPAALFEPLLEFFAQYNFTIDENDPEDHEVGIDPEMLGHIFENLLEDNKDKGAFYTPKSIVQYMCRQSLIRYLQKHLGERDELVRLVRFKDAGGQHDRGNWVRQNARAIEALLDRVKICDPAIGSGAFPIGLLQEIYWIKMTLDWTLDPAETKLKIIQDAIYGVDIDAGAVEIARLRFWLALIVDEDEPRPLPNLDYKIMQGDSLIESFEGIPLDRLHVAEGDGTPIVPAGQGQLGFAGSQPLLKSQAKAAEISGLIRDYFGETDPGRKSALHRRIDRFVLDHLEYNLQCEEKRLDKELKPLVADIARKQLELKGWTPPKKIAARIDQLNRERKDLARKKAKLAELEEKPERPYFLWRLFFQDVFEQGGFDIVIANPPYVSIEKFSRTALQEQWKARFQTYASRGDIYCFFYERGIGLLKPGGALCFISSNKFMRAGYGRGLRSLLAGQTLDAVIDFCELPVFAAATDPAIVLLEKDPPPEGHLLKAAVIKESPEIERLVEAIDRRGTMRAQESLSPEGWAMEGQEGLALLEKLRAKGKPLGEVVGGKIYYGIKTGLNEAFVIDPETRDRLIREDPRSAELIRKWIRGKDIKRWTGEWNGWHAIVFPSGFHPELRRYPAILKHLSRYEAPLKERGQCRTSRGGKSEGQHHWLELDNNPKPEYLEAFNRPKIVFNETSKELHAYVDSEGYAINKTGFIVVSDDPLYTLSIMNSSTLDYLYRSEFPAWGDPWKDGRVQFRGDRMAGIPIPDAAPAEREQLRHLAERAATAAGTELNRIEREIDAIVYRLFDLTQGEIALVESSAAGRARPATPGPESTH